jgi:hypothetical protein
MTSTTAGLFRAASDLLVVVHGTFVVFVVLGGLLVVRWPRLAWAHVPAVVWGVFVELTGRICPLTPLENEFRERSGLTTYQGDFVQHYVLPLLYPAQLTRTRQIWLGALALLINVVVYERIVRAAFSSRANTG